MDSQNTTRIKTTGPIRTVEILKTNRKFGKKLLIHGVLIYIVYMLKTDEKSENISPIKYILTVMIAIDE